MGELSGSDTSLLRSEVGVKKELIRVAPEQVPFLENTSALIDRHVDFLQKTVQPLLTKGVGYGELLGGVTGISLRLDDKEKIDIRSFILNKDYKYPGNQNIILGSACTPINTGVDLEYLVDKFPNDRWKFYLSMDTTTSEKRLMSTAFFKELVEKCKENKVSLLAKTECHDYDSPDIYTWQSITMARILKELYQKPEYAGIWYDTLHFFQRPIKGISEKHIGLAQEPAYVGPGDTSHTERMMRMGDFFDNRLVSSDDKKVNSLLFMGAASYFGVLPAEPWRIDPMRQNSKK